MVDAGEDRQAFGSKCRLHALCCLADRVSTGSVNKAVIVRVVHFVPLRLEANTNTENFYGQLQAISIFPNSSFRIFPATVAVSSETSRLGLYSTMSAPTMVAVMECK